MSTDNLEQRIASLSPKKRALLELHLFEKKAFEAEVPDITRRRLSDDCPLSSAQQRLWFLDQAGPNSPAYNMPRAWKIAGRLNVRALQEAIGAIVARHESLRTTFASVRGRPVQVVAESWPVELPIIDLTELPWLERETEAQRFLREEARRPFSLASDQMLRACLVRLDKDDHLLLLTIHHIVSDGWSMQVLLRELSELYAAFTLGQPSPLTKLPLQYRDYALWQQEWLQGDLLDAELTYWKRQLDGTPQVMELPTDYPRPQLQSQQGATQSIPLSRTLTAALTNLSRQEGVTLFMTLLAAYQTLIHRYINQIDIAVGSPVANRIRAELEGLIGFFANTLVLRTDLSGNPTFRQLLGRVRDVCLGAFAHQNLPFERLVEELQPVRDPSYSPLFQTMLVLQDAQAQILALEGLRVSTVEIDAGIARFDLTLVLEEDRKDSHLRLVYSTELFESVTIQRMLANFRVLLNGIVADPDQRIVGLPLLTGGEQHQLLVSWNDTRVDYPLGLCTHELFERQVERTPDAVAVAFEEQQITYRELNRRANQLAHYLRSLSAGPEMLIGLCVKRSVAWVVGLLGILKSGAAFVPMDPTYPSRRLAYMLQNARAPLVVTSEELQDRLSGYLGRSVYLEREESSIALESEQNPDSEVSPAQLAYMVFTSGSTGSPKGVMIDHRGLVNLTLAQIDAYAVLPGTRFLQTFSLGFDASIAQVTRPLCAGATLQLATQQSLIPGPEMIRLLLDTKVSHLNLPPSMLQLLPTKELPDVKIVIVGGEECSADLVTGWARGRRFFNAYGPTEATVGSTIHECVANGQSPPIGRPIANKQVYVLDSHLQPVPIGVSGELYIGGVGLARGYWDRPGLTAESFVPNPFSGHAGARMYKTGDLAQFLPDGNIRFLGRMDQQVKIRGFRVELEEIETILARHPSVQQALLVVREDAPGEQRLAAYFVPSQDAAPTPGDLRSFLQERLPDYMVPSAYVLLDALPLTANGKLDRNACPPPDWSSAGVPHDYVPPRTPVEEILAGIWTEVLGIDQVGIHENFFDLGGHSLLATQVISRIEATLRAKVLVGTFFEAPTVAKLTQAILTHEPQAGQTEMIAQTLQEVSSMSSQEMQARLPQTRIGSSSA